MIIERIPLTTGTPFNPSDLATHCRADPVLDMAEVTRHGLAAASELELYAQVGLLDQTVRVTLDGWPRALWLPLPIAPMVDALSVTITADGVPFDDFAAVAGQRPAIRLTDARPCGVIVIEYLAGFGPTAADIPPDLAHAIADQAAATFDTRGAGDGKTNGMSPHTARIAARYRRVAV